MDREQLDQWCERILLGLVLAGLVYAPLPLGSVRPREFVVLQWLAVVMLVVWFVRFLINPKHRLLWPPVNWAVLAFVLYAVGRYAAADVEYLARQELLRILVYAVFFYIIVHNLHRQEATQAVVLTLLGLGTLLALYGLYQHLTGSNYVWHMQRPDGYLKRGSGSFFCPNHLAGYLAMLLPMAIVGTVASRFKPLVRVFTGYAAVVMLVGIVTTFSRGGWGATLGSLIVLSIWLVQRRGQRLPILIITLGLLLLGVFVAARARLTPARFQQIYASAHTDDFRFPIWGVAWDMWRANPWWGVGPGHFDARYPQYRPPDWRLQAPPERVHNDYLNTLADWGLVGTCLVAGIFGVFFWQVGRSWRYVQRAQNDLNTRRSNKSAVVMGGTVGVIAVLLHSAIDFDFQIPANALLAVTLLALVTGHFRFAGEHYWHTVRWPLRIPVVVVLLAWIACLGWYSWRGTREAREWVAALAAPKASPRQINHLKAAFAIDPRNPDTAYRVGEALRLQSFQAPPHYRELAEASLPWFKRSSDLNPFDPQPMVKSGMSLDWLGRHHEAEPFFKRALEVDPNGMHTRAMMGWHYFHSAEYEKAKEWLEASLKVWGMNNPIATTYLRFTNEKLAEPAGRR